MTGPRLSSVKTSASAQGTPSWATGDLAHYGPGDHLSVRDIDGVLCGTLVSQYYRFPELYRQYKNLGAQLVFHSFHAGNASPEKLEEIAGRIGPELRKFNPAPTDTYPGITMPAAMTAAAASNHVWVSCPKYLSSAELLGSVLRPG
jgi:deaminated glutathione amidase